MKTLLKIFLKIGRKIRPFCLSLLFLGLTPQLSVAESYALRYEDLPDLISKRNGAAQASNLSVQASQEREGYFKRSWLPQVKVQAGVEHFKTGDYSPKTQPYGGVEVNVNIYRGGKDQLEEATRLEQTRLSESKKEKAIREELLATRLLYWELVYQREKVKALGEFSGLNRSAYQAAQLRAQRGLSTNTDALTIDLFRQQIQEEIDSAAHEIKLLQMAIATRLYLDPQAQFETVASLPHQSQVFASKSVSHPEVEALDAESKLKQIEAKRLKRYWLPSVDLYGKSYLYTLQDREFLKTQNRLDHGIGIQVHSTLLDGFQSKRDAQSQYSQALAQQTLARYKSTTLQSDGELAREELQHLDELIRNAQKYTREWRHIFKKTLEEYDLGLRSTQEVLATIERLSNLKKTELERKLEYQKILVKLSSLRGE